MNRTSVGKLSLRSRQAVAKAKSLASSTELLRIRPESRKQLAILVGELILARNDEERDVIEQSLFSLLHNDVQAEELIVLRQREFYVKTLSRLMRERNWRQRDLAKKLKVTQSTISQMVNGNHTPRPETLRKLADGLGCQPVDLWPEHAE